MKIDTILYVKSNTKGFKRNPFTHTYTHTAVCSNFIIDIFRQNLTEKEGRKKKKRK